MTSETAIPKAFVKKRIHSITGIFLVLYLIEHLLVNSQAALFIGDNGQGFVHAVNSIDDLPYLPVIEIFLLGVPILAHMWWESNIYLPRNPTPMDTREPNPTFRNTREIMLTPGSGSPPGCLSLGFLPMSSICALWNIPFLRN